MKQFLLFLFCSFLFVTGRSQQSTIYAITGQSASPFNWSDIRAIDAGQPKILFENGKSSFNLVDAYSKAEIKNFSVSFVQPQNGSRTTLQLTSPTFLMSAAAAFDKKHHRLFFATMHSGHLLWLDLNDRNEKPVFHVISNPVLLNENYNNEALNITRLAIGADGKGYAISNDGNHLIQFTTGRKVIATDLGMLHDDPSNKSISIHNQCTGWGGDIVGDISGKLILFSAGKNVFEIDLPSKVARHLGTIKNLQPAFTVNGAAVDDDGAVIISSANVQDGFYKVNMADLSAVKMKDLPAHLNASDLASGNLLSQSFAKTGVAVLPPLEAMGNDMITIYPNPVRNKKLSVTFDKNMPGTYTVAVTDLQGRLLQNSKVYVRYKGQLEKIHLDQAAVRGLYLIKVTDVVNKEIFSGKIFVE